MIFLIAFIDFEKAVYLLSNKLSDWLDMFILKMPNIVVASFEFAIAIFVARYSSKLIHKLLLKSNVTTGISYIFERLIFVTVNIIGIFIAMNLIGLDRTITSLLAGAGIIGLALSFAFQNIAANYISGILIAFRRPFDIGDIIESQKVRGRVIDISLHHTTVVNKGGQAIILPNKEIYEEPLYNYTHSQSREIELMIPLPLDSDLDHIRKIITEALQVEPGILPEEKIDVYFMKYDTYCIHTEVNYWVVYKNIKDFEESTSHGLEAIHKVLNSNNISIPAQRHSITKQN